MAHLSSTQGPEVVGAWTIGRSKLPPSRNPSRPISPGNPLDPLIQTKYKKLLAEVNAAGNAVKSPWGTAIPHLQKLEQLWGKIHALKGYITDKQYVDAASQVVAIRNKGAKAYEQDALAAAGEMNKLAVSNDYALVAKRTKDYASWMEFYNANWVKPNSQTHYTKDLPAALKGHAAINEAWQKMHANFIRLQQQMEQKRAQFETAAMELVDLLNLDMSADTNDIATVWNEKYQSTPKDVNEYRSLLAEAGVSLESGFADQVPYMIEFIKSKKAKTTRNILIGVGLAAAAAGTLAFT